MADYPDANRIGNDNDSSSVEVPEELSSMQRGDFERMINRIQNLARREVGESNEGEIDGPIAAADIKKLKWKCFKKKKDEQDNECSICCLPIENRQQYLNLKCKHVYHKRCLQEWLRKNNRCPLCRSDIRENIVRPKTEPKEQLNDSRSLSLPSAPAPVEQQ